MVHGKNTEDGGIIGYLETLGIPFVGSDIYASSVCQEKVFTKELLRLMGLQLLIMFILLMMIIIWIKKISLNK